MSKPVIIYSTQTCGYCQSAKEFMESKGVPYTEVDVGVDQAEARKMIEKSGQMGVPVIVVGEGADEELIVGFDQNRLSQALGLALLQFSGSVNLWQKPQSTMSQ